MGSTATDKARNTCLLHRACYFIWQLSFGVSRRYSPHVGGGRVIPLMLIPYIGPHAASHKIMILVLSKASDRTELRKALRKPAMVHITLEHRACQREVRRANIWLHLLRVFSIYAMRPSHRHALCNEFRTGTHVRQWYSVADGCEGLSGIWQDTGAAGTINQGERAGKNNGF